MISLRKGSSVSLMKEDPTVRLISVGLGWKSRDEDGEEFDLDASCFLLKENNKVRNDQDLIFYGNLKSQDGSVTHTGDDRSGGDGESDDEVINVDLRKIPLKITKLQFVVTIYDGERRRQNFGMIRSSYIRILNTETKQVILRYDLTEEASLDTGMIFGEVYRKDDEWRFRAIGQGVSGDSLRVLCEKYGIEVTD